MKVVQLLGLIPIVSADDSDKDNKTAKDDNQFCKEVSESKIKFNKFHFSLTKTWILFHSVTSSHGL
jgi:hypothetical protein